MKGSWVKKCIGALTLVVTASAMDNIVNGCSDMWFKEHVYPCEGHKYG